MQSSLIETQDVDGAKNAKNAFAKSVSAGVVFMGSTSSSGTCIKIRLFSTNYWFLIKKSFIDVLWNLVES